MLRKTQRAKKIQKKYRKYNKIKNKNKPLI